MKQQKTNGHSISSLFSLLLFRDLRPVPYADAFVFCKSLSEYYGTDSF